MAFGCPYTAKLFICHKSLSGPEISRRLPTLQPYKTTSVGDFVRTLRSGEKLLASNSVWVMKLHEDGDLHGDDVYINDFLANQLSRLAIYKDAFWKLNRSGEVSIEIHLKVDGHTAFVIEPDVMQLMGELGISLDIEISYCPDQSDE